jgi:hypothetical protein
MLFHTGAAPGRPARRTLEQFFRRLREKQPLMIGHEELVGMFSVPRAPCGRFATTIANGLLRNTGTECPITFDVPAMVAPNGTATLFFPSDFEGRMTVAGEDSLVFDFPDPAKAALLHVQGSSLNGTIDRLTARKDRLILRRGSGCLAFRF